MKGLGVVYRKELGALFNSPIAYIFLVAFLLLSAALFTELFVFAFKRADMRDYFTYLIPILMAFVVPAVTMRIWAEERRQGTIELLLTLPIRLSALVAGKYLASLSFVLIALLCTVPVPAVLILAWKADPGPIFTGYLGMAALAAFFVAIGMFISAQTRDQIVAFILSLLACMVFLVISMYALTDAVDGWAGGLGTFLRANFSTHEHLEPFIKGLVDVSDLLYFVAMAAMFLGLNRFTISTLTNVRERARFNLAAMLLAAIGFFAALNATEARLGRIDLTQGQVYTISDATKRILSKLRAPVRVTYYVTPSQKMPPAFKQLERDVATFLRELAVASPRVEVRVEDASAKESDLSRLGIRANTVQVSERDQVQVARVYSAIAISYLDKEEEKIEWVTPDSLGALEFEIVSRVHRLTLERKPKIAVLSTTPEAEPWMRQFGRMPRDEYSGVANMLREQGYEVIKTKVTAQDPIPADADGLLMLAPENLNERQLYEINRFVRSGRPAFIAVQNFKLSYDLGQTSVQRLEPKIESLLKAWGVTVEDSILFDASFVPLRATFAIFETELPYPVHVKVSRDNMDSSVAALNGIGSLLYMWGSPLKLDEEALKKAGLQWKVMATSSPQSWTHPTTTFSLGDLHWEARQTDLRGRLPLYVWLEGTFPDAFAGKPIPAWPEGGGTDIKPLETTGPTKVVIAGCAFQFSDMVAGRISQDNAVFFLNAVDILTHGGDMAQIRSKQTSVRAIGAMTSGQAMAYRVMMWGVMPVLLLAAGLGRLFGRQRARQAYQKAFTGA